jgi:uncharacterized integral membrane protein (TIGR00698 family)
MPSPLKDREFLRKTAFILAALFALSPFADPPLALLTGIILALFAGNPFPELTGRYTRALLQYSVVGLGFGMNAAEAAKAGRDGLLLTVITISFTLLVGLLIGRLFRVERKTAFLMSAGTAICGGSAIAAVAPVINADKTQVSVSLAIIFILNSVALFVFPPSGHLLHLSQSQFGLWSAIAIHDTSSVVGAAQKFGAPALQIATTVKLERTLWIIPVGFLSALIFRNRGTRVRIPWFILFFLVAMFLHTFIPWLNSVGKIIVFGAHKGLTLTLFLIGTGMSVSAIKNVGWKPFAAGILLWIIVSAGSLFVIGEIYR